MMGVVARERQEARLIRDLEEFLGFYNLIEIAAAEVTGRQANYVALADKSSPDGKAKKYWLIDGPNPQLPPAN